ncbi:branched-chain-amino-acid transaminase [Frankia sp. CNm7]|uniref:Branched-chain-amino-acid aminotransferase n=1 Tax=Frankia nepalensis TaxID=1836974 RepID=A0A937URQ4_9ACTN|nr:branched-chain-amino-acid transaminase [Frankia nepalensis]MBL7494922.1 branched-chain-amino-acid transaminase [Frankia nepalensis]MBL7515194.1 branched-chain-amino-acid transaminase [Frankia nepalensis]MBL7518237.1 branched-chain-amino-acid transaminase [Frankia nepalensis]MBL7629475.1 branched-chain-amino-acid transaminase [Frankia nepalensis]
MPITPTSKIWMNGELVDWDDARVHVLTPTLHYGWGVFEGIRAYATPRGSAVFRLTDHIARLYRSAKIYMMEPELTQEQFVQATKDTIAANNIESCYIRPLVYLGYGEMGLNPLPSRVESLIAVWPWGAYLGEEALEKGCRVIISSWRRNDVNITPPAAKATGQYLNSSLAKVAAIKGGYDEAILTSPTGHIADGSGENVFIVVGRSLITPPLTDGALGGITRASVMQIAGDQGYEVVEKHIVRTDLYLADEAFFTGTAAEIVPIAEVDDRAIGTGRPGPVTREIAEIFHQATTGQLDRYKDWNELVSE